MAELAPILVNNERVRLQGDPKPQVSKIVEVCGKSTDLVEVFQLQNAQDQYGKRLDFQHTIDRESTTNPVYLRLRDKATTKGAPGEPATEGRTAAQVPSGQGPGGGSPPMPGGQPPGGGPTPPGGPPPPRGQTESVPPGQTPTKAEPTESPKGRTEEKDESSED